MNNKIFKKPIYPEDISLKCESKIAFNSLDHIYPRGSSRDNSKNNRFNSKFYRLYNCFPLRVLDLGCSGGGFIRDCINDGCFAIGLEGSDYSKKMNRAEWAIIPESLHTCNITKNFSIYHKDKKQILKFHLITAWEVLEHLEEDQIDILIKNIKKHLLDEGLFIVSVANSPDKVGGINYHRTQKNKEWWIKKFLKHGFYEKKELYSYFNTQYIRGKFETKKSFHLILSLNPKKIPIHPKDVLNRLLDELLDIFKGSRIQRLLSKFL